MIKRLDFSLCWTIIATSILSALIIITIGNIVLRGQGQCDDSETKSLGMHDQKRNADDENRQFKGNDEHTSTGIHKILQLPKGKPSRLVCYYSFPLNGTGLLPEMIDDLCTHINIAFALISPNNTIFITPEQLEVLSWLSVLKTRNKKLKLLISVGGGGFDDFGHMVMSHSTRKIFIQSSMVIIKTYKLDGMDIDWEWPVVAGGPKEKVKFIQLLYELRTEFNRHKKKYFLTAAVGAAKSIIDLSYYIAHMAEHVDFINLMGYDYHFFAPFYPVTDFNAPLYSSTKDSGSVLATLNVNFSVSYWIHKGMPREKIVLGLPVYGHSYKLFSSLNHDRLAPASDVGSIGQDGSASYTEVCNFLSQTNTIRIFDNEAKVPYAYNFLEWISYDDEYSLTLKAQYIVDHGLGGAMIWSLNNDDFQGACKLSKTKFPLVKIIRSILFP